MIAISDSFRKSKAIISHTECSVPSEPHQHGRGPVWNMAHDGTSGAPNSRENILQSPRQYPFWQIYRSEGDSITHFFKQRIHLDLFFSCCRTWLILNDQLLSFNPLLRSHEANLLRL